MPYAEMIPTSHYLKVECLTCVTSVTSNTNEAVAKFEKVNSRDTIELNAKKPCCFPHFGEEATGLDCGIDSRQS
jgi:hypothetical protein